MDRKMVIAAAAALLMLTTAAAVYKAVNCGVVGAPCGSGGTPTVKCKHTPAGVPDPLDCGAACGKACGEQTSCIAAFNSADVASDCKTCCDGDACSTFSMGAFDVLVCAITPTKNCACYQACVGKCVADTQFCQAVALLRTIAGIIAAIVITINGVKFIISEDPNSRDEAKTGVWYGIVGGLVVIVAPTLVAAIMGVGLCI